MRILFVHEVDWAAKPVFEMHEFPERLAERGHDVVFLDYRESAPGPLGATRRTARGRSRPSADIELISVSTPLGGILGRLIAVAVSWWVIGRLMRTQRFDVVVLYGVPTNGWSTCWWGRRLGTPVVYRAIDVAHRLRETRWSWAVQLAERYVARSSTHVSSHNAILGGFVQGLAGGTVSSSVEVPGVELGLKPTEEDLSHLRRSLEIDPERHVVLYRGTLYRFSGVLELIDLLRPLMRRRDDILLLIVGQGEAAEEVTDHIRRHRLEGSIQLRAFVSYSDLFALFRLSDVTVNPFLRNVATDCALPGRVLQSIAAATPCVSTPLAGLRSALGDCPGLIFSELNDDFVREIQDVLNVSHRCDIKRETVDIRLPNRFSWNVAITAFEEMITQFASRAQEPVTPR